MKKENESLRSFDWFEKLKKADVVCSQCNDSLNYSKTGSWRFTGEHWEHKCENLKSSQSGHFIGVPRKQLQKDKS
jgi:hypothetical protein